MRLSYINIGIFWNNHHHMLHAAKHVNGRVLWANLFLLFWLTLVPFVIRWIDEGGVSPLPTASYGVVLAMAAVGYLILEHAIIACNGPDSMLAKAIASNWKEKFSLASYVAAVLLAFVNPWIAVALYGLNAAIWLVPDKRIEAVIR